MSHLENNTHSNTKRIAAAVAVAAKIATVAV